MAGARVDKLAMAALPGAALDVSRRLQTANKLAPGHICSITQRWVCGRSRLEGKHRRSAAGASSCPLRGSLVRLAAPTRGARRRVIMSVPPSGKISTAEVAELADALASGASGSNPIGVQIPASAPIFAHECPRRLPTIARSATVGPSCHRTSYGWQATHLAVAAQPRRRTTLAQLLLGFLLFGGTISND